eukprot:Sdes_comp19531_c0_seq1m11118
MVALNDEEIDQKNLEQLNKVEQNICLLCEKAADTLFLLGKPERNVSELKDSASEFVSLVSDIHRELRFTVSRICNDVPVNLSSYASEKEAEIALQRTCVVQTRLSKLLKVLENVDDDLQESPEAMDSL